MAETTDIRRLNVFERYLTLWVAICMVVGVGLGKLLPGLRGVCSAQVDHLPPEADVASAGGLVDTEAGNSRWFRRTHGSTSRIESVWCYTLSGLGSAAPSRDW